MWRERERAARDPFGTRQRGPLMRETHVSLASAGSASEGRGDAGQLVWPGLAEGRARGLTAGTPCIAAQQHPLLRVHWAMCVCVCVCEQQCQLARRGRGRPLGRVSCCHVVGRRAGGSSPARASAAAAAAVQAPWCLQPIQPQAASATWASLGPINLFNAPAACMEWQGRAWAALRV